MIMFMNVVDFLSGYAMKVGEGIGYLNVISILAIMIVFTSKSIIKDLKSICKSIFKSKLAKLFALGTVSTSIMTVTMLYATTIC